jgi:hypothetical protein
MSRLSNAVSKTIASAIIAVTAVAGVASAAGCGAARCRGKQSATAGKCGACKAKDAGKYVVAKDDRQNIFPASDPNSD